MISTDEINKAKELARALRDDFNWKSTKQGWEYWNEVHKNLRDLTDEEYCEKCGHKIGW